MTCLVFTRSACPRVYGTLLAVAVGVFLRASICLAVSGPEFSALLTRYGFAPEDVGYLLFDPSDGTPLEEHRADEPRIPASTTKVVTMIAALEILGATYRFETSLLATGEVRGGTLHGGIYLRGGGDPTLTTDDLLRFVAALQQNGITRLTGNFGFDESLLTPVPQIDPQQPIAATYNPGLSALSLNYNRIQLTWRRKPGAKTFVTTISSPATGGFVPVETISTGLLPQGFGRQIKFLLDGTSTDRWLLSPILPARGTVLLPVKRAPARVAAQLFRTMCRQQGIKLPPPEPAVVPAQARVLYTHQSETLQKIAAGVLLYSNNLSAELIGQVAARHLSNQPLSLPQSAAKLAEWYRQALPDTDWNGFVSVNHSGLSTLSRHSPRQMMAILRHGWTLAVGQPSFPSLLPPLRQGHGDTMPYASVRAKSGTMSYADGLVGFLTTARGQQLGFVIMLTDFSRRAELDAVLDVRITEAPPEARAWSERAKAFERELIASWLKQYGPPTRLIVSPEGGPS